MCDYSLEAYRSRPARVGERYTLTRFPSGSLGFASPPDSCTAVCVPVDTRLRLSGIPGDLQEAHGLGPSASATMAEVPWSSYRDGLRFDNGAEFSLQRLRPGITATVTELVERQAPRLPRAAFV